MGLSNNLYIIHSNPYKDLFSISSSNEADNRTYEPTEMAEVAVKVANLKQTDQKRNQQLVCFAFAMIITGSRAA